MIRVCMIFAGVPGRQPALRSTFEIYIIAECDADILGIVVANYA